MIATIAKGSESKSAVAQAATSRRLRVPVSDLELGLFVSELDRAWIGTPFLLQGFLLDNDADLESLRNHCKYVYVDLKLSDETVAAQWQATVLPSLEQVVLAQGGYEDERVVKDEPKLTTHSDATPMQSGFAQASGGEQDEADATTLVGPTPIENRRTRRTRSGQARNDPPGQRRDTAALSRARTGNRGRRAAKWTGFS
jgi:hypothetical protein